MTDGYGHFRDNCGHEFVSALHATQQFRFLSLELCIRENALLMQLGEGPYLVGDALLRLLRPWRCCVEMLANRVNHVSKCAFKLLLKGQMLSA